MATFALNDNIYKVFNEKETYYATEQYLNLCGFDLKIEPDAEVGTLDHYGDLYVVVRANDEKYSYGDDDRVVKTLRCCYDQIFYPDTQMLSCPSIAELEQFGHCCEEEGDHEKYLEDVENEEYKDIYQTFFIDGATADFLNERTEEMVFYVPDFDMYVLGVSHYGTSWGSCEAEIKF